MPLSTLIYIVAVFVIFLFIPLPWYVALVVMIGLYFVSPWFIQKIEYILWRLNRLKR